MNTRVYRKIHGTLRANGGSTLIELLIYIALSVGLLVGIGTITLSMLDARTKTVAMNDVLNGGTFTMNTLRELFTSSGSLLSPLPTTASSGALYLPTATNIPILVATSGDRLIIRTQGGNTRLVSTPHAHLERLEFSAVGDSATSTGVRVSFSLAASSQGLWRSAHYRESFVTTFLFEPR